MRGIINNLAATIWESCWLLDAFARAFQPIPREPIWKWAESVVWLDNKEAAEPGFYRSAKTPWTRRLQDLIKTPKMFVVDYSTGGWSVEPVTEFNKKKSSQSGVSEAALNGIRWKAKYQPVNTIYAIDTREEAKNILKRLLPSLQKVDPDIFTGDSDDIGTMIMSLVNMEIWFYGSFSSGKFANKQAPFVIADELEEHGQQKGDTSTRTNLGSRKKTSNNGFQINLSKPKKDTGPICKAFDRGNQEEYHIECPHRHELQWLTMFPEEKDVPFSKEVTAHEIDGVTHWLPTPLPPGEFRKVKTGRLVFSHCKDVVGKWDRLRILRETYYECCECKGRIDEWRKASLVENAKWIPTAIGTPGIVSQHISDLYSSDLASKWGQIVLDFLDAEREGRTELQGIYNHRLGLGFADRANKVFAADIKRNIADGQNGCAPYKKGVLPFAPAALVLGSDVGGNYAKWSVLAVHPNYRDVAVIDWGEELDPFAIAEIVRTQVWMFEGKAYRIGTAFMDAKYRKGECYKACMSLPKNVMIPTAGLGGGAARSKTLFSFHVIQEFKRLSQLTYNDREAKDDLYVACIKEFVRRIWFPIDVMDHEQFVKEMTAESLKPDADGVMKWDEHPGANHWGDTVKEAVVGLRWLTRKMRTE